MTLGMGNCMTYNTEPKKHHKDGDCEKFEGYVRQISRKGNLNW